MSRNWLIGVRTTAILNMLTCLNILLCMTALRNRPVAHTFLPSFDNASGRLCQERLGSLSKYDGNGAKRSLKEWLCAVSNFIALIPFYSICQLLTNFSGVEFQRTVPNLRERTRKLLSYIHVPKICKNEVWRSLHALKDWWDKSNVRWFLREQTSDKVCQYKKSRSSLFILAKENEELSILKTRMANY